MRKERLLKALRFYFITDCDGSNLSVLKQVEIAINSGATSVQYRNKNFGLSDYDEVVAICSICRKHGVMFIVNDNILLAKAIQSDGLHLGQGDEKIELARKILGDGIILGLSASTVDELNKSDLQECDYIGFGPVFETKTKMDSKCPSGLDVLKNVILDFLIPTVAIGGIDSINARDCMNLGAAGVAAISYITRSSNPKVSAADLARSIFLTEA